MKLDSKEKVNFEAASILLLESSSHSLDVLSQIFQGFGARKLHRATTLAEAKQTANRTVLDLIVMEPNLADDDGYEFIRWLRRTDLDPNRTTPIILVSSSGTIRAIGRARNSGANFFVAKPLTPMKLLDRILWVTRDPRPFFEGESYVGPDRRFKFEGPPPGEAPRRSTDLDEHVGEATEPNMSQSEIDSLLKPQKVQL